MKNTQISNPKNEAREASKAEGRSPFLLWLIWVVWLPLIIPAFVSLFQAHLTLPRLVATLVGVALFFAIYLWASWRRAQRLVAASSLSGHIEASTWLAIAVLPVLSLALTLLGGNEWLSLFFYTSGFVGGGLSIRWTILATVALTLLVMAISLLTGLGWLALVQVVVFVPGIILITRIVMWSITTSWELHAARKEIAHLAVMTERLRIARDLHDLLGHNLSLIALKSELARRLIGVSPERAAAEIGDVENVARTTLQEVREAVAAYRQPTLSGELHGAQEILAAAGIAYQYEGDESIMGSLPPAVEAVLAWTVREGVTNVICHSRAHQCAIRVMREQHDARIEVIDDGVGVPGDAGNGGSGLHGLAERVAAIGGRFEASPCAGGGFRLAVSAPLALSKHDAQTPGAPAVSSAHRAPAADLERVGGYEERGTQQ